MAKARLPDFPGWNRLSKTNKPKAGDRIDFVSGYVPPFEWTIEYDWYVTKDGGISKDVAHGTRFWSGFAFDYWRISNASRFEKMMVRAQE